MAGSARHLRQVIVVSYDSAWPQQYEQAAAELSQALGANLVAIHHIGSTAIPGIHAKPIIDLLPVVRDLSVVDECTPAIQHLGYEGLGELGITGRRYFRRFNGAGQRTHHVHVFQQDSPHIDRHLAFRDYVRAHPSRAEQYGELKQRLAAEHPENWDAYCDGKDVLVQELEAQALRWYESTRSTRVAELSGNK